MGNYGGPDFHLGRPELKRAENTSVIILYVVGECESASDREEELG